MENVNTAYSIETTSGTFVDLNNPKAEVINPFDIAMSLSRLARFNGHAFRNKHPYSVAQHSVDCFERMKRIRGASPSMIAWGLLHDAHEAYIGDLSRPLGALLGSQGFSMLRAIKHKFDQAICQRFGIDQVVLDPNSPQYQQIKIIDEQALRDEAFTFMKSKGKDWEWSARFDGIAPCKVDDPITPIEASTEFLDRMSEVYRMGFRSEMD